MSTRSHRFPMLISGLGQLSLVPFGVTSQRTFAEINEDELHVRFGPIFDERIPLSQIKEVVHASWPRWAGIGPRVNFRGAVGLVGANSNTVVLRFKSPQRVRLFVAPVSCQRLYLSLHDPEGFIEALKAARQRPARPAKAA